MHLDDSVAQSIPANLPPHSMTNMPMPEPISPAVPKGVFIMKGMRIRIPAGGFRIEIHPNGSQSTSLTIELAVDFTPHWLSCALEHLGAAQAARAAAEDSAVRGDEQAMGEALEREVRASMQAIVGAATAFDAFYALLLEYVSIPSDLVRRWKKNRTARHRQVAEVMRRAIRLSGETLVGVQRVLSEVYRIRDMAVHPSAAFGSVVRHPGLPINSDWRLAAFRVENARAAVHSAVSIIAQCHELVRDSHPALRKHFSEVKSGIETVVQEFERQTGLQAWDARPAPA